MTVVLPRSVAIIVKAGFLTYPCQERLLSNTANGFMPPTFYPSLTIRRVEITAAGTVSDSHRTSVLRGNSLVLTAQMLLDSANILFLSLPQNFI